VAAWLSVLVVLASWGQGRLARYAGQVDRCRGERFGQDDWAALAPDVIALADASYMTEAGRAIFYGTRPQIVDRQEEATQCEREEPASGGPLEASFQIGGCFVGDGTGQGAIYLSQPEDPRLYGYLMTAAAHERLHAAWETLDLREQAVLGPILEAELAAMDPADPLHQQIAWSLGDESAAISRGTELFAALGAHASRTGGLAPRLEELYSRFIGDRAALVTLSSSSWMG
jgi:hypothetical protein